MGTTTLTCIIHKILNKLQQFSRQNHIQKIQIFLNKIKNNNLNRKFYVNAAIRHSLSPRVNLATKRTRNT